MKKFVCLMVVFAFMLTTLLGAYAQENDDAVETDVDIVQNLGLINSDIKEVRFFPQNTEFTPPFSNDTEVIKALLGKLSDYAFTQIPSEKFTYDEMCAESLHLRFEMKNKEYKYLFIKKDCIISAVGSTEDNAEALCKYTLPDIGNLKAEMYSMAETWHNENKIVSSIQSDYKVTVRKPIGFTTVTNSRYVTIISSWVNDLKLKTTDKTCGYSTSNGYEIQFKNSTGDNYVLIQADKDGVISVTKKSDASSEVITENYELADYEAFKLMVQNSFDLNSFGESLKPEYKVYSYPLEKLYKYYSADFTVKLDSSYDGTWVSEYADGNGKLNVEWGFCYVLSNESNNIVPKEGAIFAYITIHSPNKTLFWLNQIIDRENRIEWSESLSKVNNTLVNVSSSYVSKNPMKTIVANFDIADTNNITSLSLDFGNGILRNRNSFEQIGKTVNVEMSDYRETGWLDGFVNNVWPQGSEEHLVQMGGYRVIGNDIRRKEDEKPQEKESISISKKNGAYLTQTSPSNYYESEFYIPVNDSINSAWIYKFAENNRIKVKFTVTKVCDIFITVSGNGNERMWYAPTQNINNTITCMNNVWVVKDSEGDILTEAKTGGFKILFDFDQYGDVSNVRLRAVRISHSPFTYKDYIAEGEEFAADMNNYTFEGRSQDFLKRNGLVNPAFYGISFTEKPTEENEKAGLNEEKEENQTVSYSNDVIFDDVPSDYWAYKEIKYFYNAGAVEGINDSLFAPEDNITREQFAKLLAIIFSKTKVIAKDQTFSDVTPDLWSHNYIEAVKDYLTGYYPTGVQPFFNPEGKATREDIAVALVKISEYKKEGLSNSIILEETFSDSDDISPALREYVGLAVENNLIKGYEDGTFKPRESITRAETVVLLFRALKLPVSDTGVDKDKPKPSENTSNEKEQNPTKVSVSSSAPLDYKTIDMEKTEKPDSCEVKAEWTPGSREASYSAVFKAGGNEYRINIASVRTVSEDGIYGTFRIMKGDVILGDNIIGYVSVDNDDEKNNTIIKFNTEGGSFIFTAQIVSL